LFETSSIFVLPSYAENFPLVLLEAMAAGAAIVTTDQTGCREVVGDAALLVRAGDEQAIRAAFERLGSDADLRERLGREARNRIDKLFSWPAVAGQYVDVFESLSSLHGQRMNAAEIK
jgi:glycosyltransferase involved in cell wall biosynthesis